MIRYDVCGKCDFGVFFQIFPKIFQRFYPVENQDCSEVDSGHDYYRVDLGLLA